MRKSWIEIDLGRLRKNIRNIRSALAPATQTIFIVKADAYSHGLTALVEVAVEEGTEWFGVAYLDEALAVRAAAPSCDILILGVVEPEDVELLAKNNITALVVSAEHAAGLGARARELGVSISVHLKLDSGMGRLGILPSDFKREARAIAAVAGVQITGLCSHFSKVEPNQPEAIEKQIKYFRNSGQVLEEICGRNVLKHIASSRACFLNSEWDYDAVRLGIVVYGYGASATFGRFHTDPILQWKTSVMQVRELPAGHPISYYGTYETETDTRMAVIALGYADGYLRTLSNRGCVLIRGKRYPVVGRVTMNWICVDVGDDSDVSVGDEVVVLGEQGNASVWAGELAQYCRTIPYEIVTGINPGIPRHYIDDK